MISDPSRRRSERQEATQYPQRAVRPLCYISLAVAGYESTGLDCKYIGQGCGPMHRKHESDLCPNDLARDGKLAEEGAPGTPQHPSSWCSEGWWMIKDPGPPSLMFTVQQILQGEGLNTEARAPHGDPSQRPTVGFGTVLLAPLA